MDEQPGLSDQYRTSSPWPLLVAFAIAIAEVGIVLGVVPLAMGGLLLLLGSITGIVREAGYVESPWPLLNGLALLTVVLGIGVYLLGSAPPTVDGLLAATNAPGSVSIRGVAIVGSGLLAMVLGAVGRVWLQTHSVPTR